MFSRELGGLPLALDHAAAYIEKKHLTLQAYLDLFRKYKLRLFSDTQPHINYHYTVAITWQIFLEKIIGEATRQLLYLSAFLDSDHISKQLFSAGVAVLPRPLAKAVTNEISFNKMLTELNTYSLIQWNEDDLWSINSLLQEVIRESLAKERAGWAECVLKLLCHVYNFDYFQPKTWEKAGQVIPHMQAAIETAVSLQIDNVRSGWIYNEIGVYFNFQGRYKEAEPLYQRALEIYERVLGSDHPDTATTLSNLADLYDCQGRYEKAESLYQRALEILIKVLGKEHPNTQTCLKNLAKLHQSKNQEAGSTKNDKENHFD